MMRLGRGFTALLLLNTACSSNDEDAVPFVLSPTIAEVGNDPLAGTNLSSCPIYLEERCDGTQRLRCALYDTEAEQFVDTPDPLLERVLLYDRWYDLYTSPLGLTMERVFDGPMPGDTPESEWGAPDRFDRWAGNGDAAIWTGAALVADIFRYVATRTEADYQRMEDKVRVLVRNFEVTGVPGYLARYHYLQVPPGTAKNDQLILRENDPGRVDIPLPSLDVEGLPGEYALGVDDGQGGRITGTAHWNGDPSIDQYTGPMTAFPLAYNLLRDEALKAKMVHHLTCYLKRLERIEIINLKSRPDLVDEVRAAFGGTELNLDPDDPDIDELETMVWYVHPGINSTNVGAFAGTCPDRVQLTPSRVIDARSDSFELDLLELSADLNREIRRRENQIDHFYIVSLRGGDASHLMHLAAMAYYFTGEEQYRSFLFDELIGKLRAVDVARTMMAFRLPDWCFRFYGDHITYGTHWQFITMLPESELKQQMIRVMEEEAWQKAHANQHSAKFNVMYASVVPPEVATARDEAIASAVRQIRDFGGNGGTQNAPRRTHNVSRQSIIDRFPAGTTVRCPTEQQRASCENGGTLLGFPLEGSNISHECDGRAGECMMSDGKCTDGLASEGLPASLRIYADFMWQRSPFDIGNSYAIDGQKQSPGRDLAEPYWMARHYGYIEEGRGQVLAWREAGTCP